MTGAAALALAGLMSLAAPATPPGSPAGDGVAARIALPADEITVGDPVFVKLTVTHPPGAVLDYPDAGKLSAPAAEGEPPDTTAPPRFIVEEVQPVEVKPPRPGETSWSIRIRPFAPGDITIPALTLTYRMPGSSQTRSVTTEPLDLHVKSVLKDKDEKPADIKDPWWIPRAWWPWILGALAALAALAGLRAVWRRWRRRKPAAPQAAAAPAQPAEPPYQRALRELERLLASGLLAQGRVKEFHVLLSEIVKRFLGAHCGFDALDRTTVEVLADLSRLAVDRDVQDRARLFLESCDLVKFAKHRPGPGDVDETIDAARTLIRIGSRRVPETAGGVAA